MVREVLFRGKTEKNDNWVYGSLNNTDHQFPDIVYCDKNWSVCSTSIKPETIGEFTGLTDKNGTKIFEGDIVKGNFPYAEICIVVWSDKRCGFYLQPISKLGKASYDPYYKLNSAKLEIIGNIFDNRELLNED